MGHMFHPMFFYINVSAQFVAVAIDVRKILKVWKSKKPGLAQVVMLPNQFGLLLNFVTSCKEMDAFGKMACTLCK